MKPPEAKPNVFLRDLRRRVAGYRGMKRFASLCGLAYTSYRNYEIGRNRVPFPAAKAISEATGEDPFAIMSDGGTLPETPQLEVKPREFTLHSRGRPKLSSFREAKDFKSRTAVSVTESEFGKGDDFLRGGNRLAFHAGDDSMQPSIAKGDLLVFDSKAKPKNGSVVCAALAKDLMVVRYFRDAKRKTVILQPDSRAHQPVFLPDGKPESKKLSIRGVLISLRRTTFSAS